VDCTVWVSKHPGPESLFSVFFWRTRFPGRFVTPRYKGPPPYCIFGIGDPRDNRSDPRLPP